jgi:hypothetical protein
VFTSEGDIIHQLFPSPAMKPHELSTKEHALVMEIHHILCPHWSCWSRQDMKIITSAIVGSASEQGSIGDDPSISFPPALITYPSASMIEECDEWTAKDSPSKSERVFEIFRAFFEEVLYGYDYCVVPMRETHHHSYSKKPITDNAMEGQGLAEPITVSCFLDEALFLYLKECQCAKSVPSFRYFNMHYLPFVNLLLRSQCFSVYLLQTLSSQHHHPKQ